MNDKLQALQDDIAFLKQLAEEGRAPPMLGGSIMVMAGSVFGTASLIHWAIATGHTPITTPWAYPIVWLGAVAVFMAALSVLRSRLGGLKTVAARASGVAWAGVGWTILALSISIAVVAWRVNSAIPTMLFPPICLALYGLGWLVAAAVSRKRWIGFTAAGCYAAAVVTAFFSTGAVVFLVYAAALALLAILPGAILMRTSANPA